MIYKTNIDYAAVAQQIKDTDPYRLLEEGEVILVGDEIICTPSEKKDWRKLKSGDDLVVGKRYDPKKLNHRIIRRRK